MERLAVALMKLTVIVVITTAAWCAMPEDRQLSRSAWMPLAGSLLPLAVLFILNGVGGRPDESGIGQPATVIEMLALVIGLSPAVYMTALCLESAYALGGLRGCGQWLIGPGYFYLIVTLLAFFALLSIVARLIVFVDVVQRRRRTSWLSEPVERITVARYALAALAALALISSFFVYVSWLDDSVASLSTASASVKLALMALGASLTLGAVEHRRAHQPVRLPRSLLPAEIR
jgi:hypothetical protein